MIPRSPEAQRMINVLGDKNRELTAKNTEMQELVEKAAQAKHDYLIAFTAKIVKLRIAGEPATLAKELAKGDEEVARLQYKWDIAEGVLLACRERIKDLRDAASNSARSILSFCKTELEIEARLHGHDGQT